MGSAVVPDLLATMKSVFSMSSFRSRVAIIAGSVVSSTVRGRPCVFGWNICLNTSGARLEPPMPMWTTRTNPAALTSRANAIRSAACSFILAGASSHPSADGMESATALSFDHKLPSFFQRRSSEAVALSFSIAGRRCFVWKEAALTLLSTIVRPSSRPITPSVPRYRVWRLMGTPGAFSKSPAAAADLSFLPIALLLFL